MPGPAGTTPTASGETRLLALWDTAIARHPLDRAVLLAGSTDAADLDLGARDAAILAARERLFGTAIAATFACGRCSERLEITLETDALATACAPGGPTSRDLADALALRDPAAGRKLLAARVAGVAVDQLDDATIDRLEAELEAAGAPGDLMLGYQCPACGETGETAFDPAWFVWHEVDRAAGALFDEVATLARGYGWTEAESLALPASRRARYLERLA